MLTNIAENNRTRMKTGLNQKLIHRLDEMDHLIKEGKSQIAEILVKELLTEKVPREYMARVAHLSIRAGFPHGAVKLLHKVVRPEDVSSSCKIGKANEAERAEYALGLIRIGASFEGLEILRGLKSDSDPNILFYQVAGLFTQWDYSEAIPLLRKYISCLEMDDYRYLIGLVNLSDALFFDQKFEEALSTVLKAITQAQEKQAVLLHGNCLEMLARIHIAKKNYSEAEKALMRASKCLGDMQSLDLFFVRKWDAILSLNKNGDIKPIQAIRKEALTRNHWETVRDCDYYQGTATMDQELLTYLYHGTPFLSFRKRLLMNISDRFIIPENYLWKVNGEHSKRTFDLNLGAELDTQTNLKLGQARHRLLGALASDFYRPFRPATLFSIICPGEYYHPTHSVHRIYQLLAKLRKWFLENNVPLSIVEISGQYRLTCTKPYAVNTYTKTQSKNPNEIHLKHLKKEVQDRSFSVNEITHLFEMSKKSIVRILNWGISEGMVRRTGSTNKIVYQFSRTV